MSLTRTLVAATVAASLALAPALAEARAGSKSSGGSKGSKTTTTAPKANPDSFPTNNLSGSSSGNTSSTPIYPTPQKAPQSAVSGGQALPPPNSTAPNSAVNPQGATAAAPSAAAPAAGTGTTATAPGAMGAPRMNTPAAPTAPAAQPSFMQRNPLLTGIAGGLLGATIANSLFGNGSAQAAPAEGSETGSLIGTVLKWALILGAVALVVSMFRRLMRPAAMGPAEPSFRMGPPSANPGEPRIGFPQAAAPAAAVQTTDIARKITGPDYDQFTAILTGLQGAWSAGDIAAMARWATPEMQRFFAAELARNEARGFVNHIEDVELVNGDVVEAWSEGHAEFCTARVTFSARDYDVAIGKQRGEPGWIVDGDPNHKVEATEIWTFARQPGQAWQLSAIEQTETV